MECTKMTTEFPERNWKLGYAQQFKTNQSYKTMTEQIIMKRICVFFCATLYFKQCQRCKMTFFRAAEDG